MEQKPTRDRKRELETLKEVEATKPAPSKIISLKQKLSIVPLDYIDSKRRFLIDHDKGLTTHSVQEIKKQGFVNVIPGLEKSSWFDSFLCCSSRDHTQEDYAKIIRKHLSAKSRVIRDGKIIEVDREELVPGDILVLAEGDKVNADLLLLEISKEHKRLAVNSFLYTESDVPYEKEKITSIGDPWERQELILAGTEVVAGGGKAIVLAIGEKTAIGLIMKSFEHKNAIKPE